MTPSQFKKLVENALAEIPERFREALENITIEVETSQMIRDPHHHLILGHYIGIPFHHG